MFFSKSRVKKLSMEQAALELSSKDIVLIDVRSAEEYREGHIKGSINIPLSDAQKIKDLVPNLSARLFVYCLSGGRSHSACVVFDRLGYFDITNIGGIGAWRGEIERG